MCVRIIVGANTKKNIQKRDIEQYREVKMPKIKKITVVRGIRATDMFWEKCNIIARLEKTDRNKLIVKVMEEYYEQKMKEAKKD